MPRHNRRGPEAASSGAPQRSLGEQLVRWRGEEYVVRAVTGADKTYRCPGCDQEIRPALPHVVAWPSFGDGAEDRRHWHHPCWTARDRRAPGVQWTRSAPRY
jgi:hypothetical protein